MDFQWLKKCSWNDSAVLSHKFEQFWLSMKRILKYFEREIQIFFIFITIQLAVKLKIVRFVFWFASKAQFWLTDLKFDSNVWILIFLKLKQMCKNSAANNIASSNFYLSKFRSDRLWIQILTLICRSNINDKCNLKLPNTVLKNECVYLNIFVNLFW